MADGNPDWASVSGIAMTAVAGLVAVVLWVPKQIVASRHKMMGDLQEKWKSFDQDIERLDKDVGDLKTRVAVLETKADISQLLNRQFDRLVERLSTRQGRRDNDRGNDGRGAG